MKVNSNLHSIFVSKRFCIWLTIYYFPKKIILRLNDAEYCIHIRVFFHWNTEFWSHLLLFVLVRIYKPANESYWPTMRYPVLYCCWVSSALLCSVIFRVSIGHKLHSEPYIKVLYNPKWVMNFDGLKPNSK